MAGSEDLTSTSIFSKVSLPSACSSCVRNGEASSARYTSSWASPSAGCLRQKIPARLRKNASRVSTVWRISARVDMVEIWRLSVSKFPGTPPAAPARPARRRCARAATQRFPAPRQSPGERTASVQISSKQLLFRGARAAPCITIVSYHRAAGKRICKTPAPSKRTWAAPSAFYGCAAAPARAFSMRAAGNSGKSASSVTSPEIRNRLLPGTMPATPLTIFSRRKH